MHVRTGVGKKIEYQLMVVLYGWSHLTDNSDASRFSVAGICGRTHSDNTKGVNELCSL